MRPDEAVHYVELTRHVGARDSRGVVTALAALAATRESPECVADILRTHHLISLTETAIAEPNGGPTLPAALAEAIAARRPASGVRPEAMLDAFEDVRSALAADGIPTLQLKGLLFAERLYGDLWRRPQHDIDVLVPRRRFRPATKVLGHLGYARDSYDLHSRTFLRGPVKVDLHRSLRWAPAYRVDERAVWGQVRVAHLAGHAVPTTSDEHTLLLLVLAIFEDVGQGMGRLKQLLDLLLLTRDVDATFDWAAFLGRRAGERVLGVSVNVLALVIDVFDAAAELPRLAEALQPYRRSVRHGSREEALRLVMAPRKDPANLAWFRRVYPGSFPLYLAFFWGSGFPANLRDPRRPPLWRTVALASRRG